MSAAPALVAVGAVELVADEVSTASERSGSGGKGIGGLVHEPQPQPVLVGSQDEVADDAARPAARPDARARCSPARR